MAGERPTIVCVGRNYAAHAAELGHDIPARPLLFIKPPSALQPFADGLHAPRGLGRCDFETELALRIDRPLADPCPAEAEGAVSHLALALDLTLRDIQTQLKRDGHPWERAKAFPGACPIAPWVPRDAFGPLDDIRFRLRINGDIRQDGHTAMMLHSPAELVREAARCFRLAPGDIVLTGTPAGVGPLTGGQTMTLELEAREETHAWTARTR